MSPGSSSTRSVGVSILAVIVAVTGITLVAWRIRDSKSSDLRVRLARAVGERRVIKPRLTGGFRHAPCAAEADPRKLITGLVCSGGRALSGSPEMEGLASELHAISDRDASSETRHAKGVWNLLWPDLEGSVDNAVASLRAAAAHEPGSAATLSDLAAALLVRAEVSESPEDLVDALSVADSAVALDGALPEARFNRALALERLFLLTEAGAAWTTYVALDARSPWANEVHGHLEQLARPPPGGAWDDRRPELERAALAGEVAAVREIVTAFPQAAREHLFTHTLPEWARSRGARGARASDSLLAIARTVAAEIRGATGNVLLAEAVAAIDRARADHETGRLQALGEGQLTLAHGIDRYQGGAYREAESLLATAERLLGSGGSPLREWAGYYRGLCLYYGAAYDEALLLFDAIQRRTTADRYPVIWARVGQMRALIHEIRANYAAAFSIRRSLPPVIRRTGEIQYLARQYTTLAGLSFILQSDREAWRQLYEALKLTPSITSERERYTVFARIGQHLAPTHARVAIRFQDVAIQVATASADPRMISSAFRTRAEILDRVGETEAARRDIGRAARFLDSISNRTTHAIVKGDLRLVSGEVNGRRRPHEALGALAEAIDIFRDTEYHLKLPRAHLAVARALLAQNEYDEADSALALAIREMESQRDSLGDYAERAQFQDKARPVFDEMVAFQARRRRPEAAFDYVERMRARALLEQVSAATRSVAPRPHTPLGGSEIRRRLPQDVVLVTYAVLEREVISWSLTRDSVHMTRSAIASDSVRVLVGRMVTAVLDRRAAADFEVASAALYRALMEPTLARISPRARLVIVPDKWLHFLPFAALWNAAGGRFLIEERELTIAPSASLYVYATERYRRLTTPVRHRMLAIGNPAFDRSAFRLPDLPHAELEARRVGEAYPGATVLTGASATRSAFLAQAPGFDVIHFAGHAVVRPEAPLLSHLVLAADSGDHDLGALYARELYDQRLPHTILVILSGCHTSTGRVSATEGASSLARAFLAAGVPAVVASLWAVEDRNTAEFFTDYHRRLGKGEDPVAALRATQMEWIASHGRWGATPTWAAFQVFGAVG